jgi:hypothetical protein
MSNSKQRQGDGVTEMVPRGKMCGAAAKLCDTYKGCPDAPFYYGLSGGICG